ncbi:alpha/beta-hydrolase [Sistotremastrum niveocremeum HHB9708]|uniref:triacylglycerol lipase n=2 Tax=Sistotremastraceae TaxID=3402574 RepID=A0A164WJA2_9AGAM|nr:alpha/beta-hydrolase [Sistotremastrum niveocremeum HHB9708]KZT34624.1 alpha/beta-hydrolase [Sistotremastrum suecicum HHB10207 ss-3]
MLPSSLQSFLSILLLSLGTHSSPTQHPLNTPKSSHLQFQLRHLHATGNNSRIIFKDVHTSSFAPLAPSSPSSDLTWSLPVRTSVTKRHRPKDLREFARARRRSRDLGESAILEWIEEDVDGPDVTDRGTVLELAKMTNNAYVEDDKNKEWYNIGDGWNHTRFGWEPDADGFRGHVFASTDNSTVILSIKGTSAGLFGGGGPTAKKDKLNDNLLFSCCCARISWQWTTVCDCYRGGGYSCDQTCLEGALAEESLFYPIGINLYNNLTYIYPHANIWVIGHSLGGALASLIGVTFGAPVVTFEAPGERMAARRLHLPSPPSTQHVTHFYHTADPIPMGVCTGPLSSCWLGGYAMESRCHLGRSAVFDTVTKLGWSVDVRTHGIVAIIDRLLSQEWEKGTWTDNSTDPNPDPSKDPGKDKDEGGSKGELPLALPEDDCVDCFSWEYQ